MQIFNDYTNGDVSCNDALLYGYTRCDSALQELQALSTGNILNLLSLQLATVPPKKKSNGNFPAFHFCKMTRVEAGAELILLSNDGIARELEDLRRAGLLA